MCMISCFTWLGSMTLIIIHNSIEQHVQFVHNATWLTSDNDYGNYVLRMIKHAIGMLTLIGFFLSFEWFCQ